MNDEIARVQARIESAWRDGGNAYYVRGHVPTDLFIAALRRELEVANLELDEEPTHCWKRICRDFAEGRSMIVEAAPNSRGAFRCTWGELIIY